MNLNLDIDVQDAVSESIEDSVSDTNQDLNASIHTGKCIRRFGGRPEVLDIGVNTI